jgi:hypothetical protein
MKALRRLVLPLFVVSLAAGLFLLALSWWTAEAPNYSRIEDGLYVGGSVPRPPRGTRAVLNLCEIEDGYRVEVSAWEPIHDGEPAPKLDWLRQRVAWVDANRRAGRTTFIHCRNGASRSGLVVTAYLMWRDGLSRDEALDYVRARRPVVRPNPAFLRLLLDWEREVRAGTALPAGPSSPTVQTGR